MGRPVLILDQIKACARKNLEKQEELDRFSGKHIDIQYHKRPVENNDNSSDPPKESCTKFLYKMPSSYFGHRLLKATNLKLIKHFSISCSLTGYQTFHIKLKIGKRKE